MSEYEVFQQAAKKFAVRLRCRNSGELEFRVNEKGCPECKLVMCEDSNKILSYNGKSVYWRPVNEKASRAYWREFGSLSQFASAV